jgi:dimethylargininase
MSVLDYDRALVRTPPRAYSRAYAAKRIHIDFALAEAQHQTYVSTLEQAGTPVSWVAPAEQFYDCVFIEDTVVVWHDRALVTRMTGHRQGEQSEVAAALRTSHLISELSAESRLEGGDVLHTEETTYVGLTQRTNDRGAQALSDFLGGFGRRVVPVLVSGALHLKTIATYLGNGTLLVAPEHVDARVFDVDEVIVTASKGNGCANCLRVRDTLIVPEGYPHTLEQLRVFADKHSVRVVPVNLSEFEKGDGSATCLSVLWREGSSSHAHEERRSSSQ